jgi:hypothetical protein
MKAQPVIIEYVPDDGELQIWIGNECLIVDGFLKGLHIKDSNKTVYAAVLTEHAQTKIIKKLVNNLPE